MGFSQAEKLEKLDKLQSNYLDILSEYYNIDTCSGYAMLYDVNKIINQCLSASVITSKSFEHAKKLVNKSVVDMTSDGISFEACDALLNYATKRLQILL